MTASPSQSPPPRGAQALPAAAAERYRVDRVLVVRPEKEVLLAWDRTAERQVALTVLDKRRGAARHESAVLEQLGDHRHIVTVYETIETDDAIVVVNRYYGGGNLHEVLRAAGVLSVARALEIAAEICSGLDAAHRAGVVHADLKPTNVLIGPRGEAVLADFGLAWRTRRPGLAAVGDEERAPGGRGDLLMGTPAYMAPEVATGGAPDARSDLYSLGCLLFELLTGHPPFVSRDANEVLRRQVAAPPPSLADARPDAPRLLEAIVARLLRKRPNERPASAHDIRVALEGAFSSAVSSVFAARSRIEPGGESAADRASGEDPVGRDREIEALDRATRDLAAGRPALLALVGEPGIGKSRLLEAFVTRAEALGVATLVGEGVEGAANVASAAHALAPLTAWADRLPPDDASDLRRFLDVARSEPAATGEVERDRERTSRSVFRALAALAEDRPVALVLEDLHWMDSGAADLLEDLALRLALQPLPVALVLAVRPPEPGSSLASLLERLKDHAAAAVLEVGPLAPADVDAALRRAGIRTPSDVLVSSLHEASHGNPLFLREMVERLRRAGGLDRASLTISARSLLEAAVPDSFAAGVAARASGMRAESRDVVAIGAVLGGRLRPEALAALSARSVENVRSALEEGTTAGILTRDAASGFRFAHPLIRSAILGLTPAERRQEHHLRIARWLAEDGDGDGASRLPERAHHLIHAGALADPREVVATTRLAGMRALEAFSCQEAAALLESALEAGSAHELLSAREAGELHRLACLARFYRFDRDACAGHYKAAVEALGAAHDPIGLARALNDQIRTDVMFGQRGYGVLGDVGPLEAALERLPESEVALRARILGTLAEAYWGAVRPGEAVDLATRGLALARASGDDAVVVEISTQLAICLLQSLRLEEALAVWEEGLARARATRNLHGEEQCLQRLPLVLYMMGRLDEAAESARAARALNATVRSAGDSSWPMAVLAAIAALRGDHAAALHHGQETIDLVRRYRYPWSGAFALSTIAASQAARGDWRRAREAVERTIEPGYLLEDPSGFHSTARQHLLLLRLWSADRPAPDEPIDCPTPPTEDTGFDIAFIPSLCAQVEIAVALARPDLLAGVAAALARARGRGVLVSIAWPHLLPRIQGLVERAEGRLESAVAYFEEARRIARELGAEPEAARTALDHAELLLARHGDGDREHAHALLREAEPLLRRHLPQSMRERAEKTLVVLARR